MPEDDDAHDAQSGNFLTRREVARRLGISLSSVRQLEARKELHPMRRKIDAVRYKFVFRAREVEAVAELHKRVSARALPDVRDQKVFLAFREGKTVVDVVIEMGLSSDVVAKLWKTYREGLSQGEGAARLEPTEAEVLEQIERDNKAQDAELAKTFESIARLRVTRAATIKNRRKGAA